MRFEINIPDSTRPEHQAMFVTLTRRLSESPELIVEIESREREDAAIQRMFTADRLAHIAAADAEIDAGNCFTAEQVDKHFKKKRDAWIERSQR